MHLYFSEASDWTIFLSVRDNLWFANYISSF